MLGKLIKHEFRFLIKDFTRTYIFYGVSVLILKLLIVISGDGRSVGTAMATLLAIFAIIYYIFTFILALLTISHNVRRFKKNMYSQEGYLTNTLPVTPAQHVIAKVIGGFVNYVLSFFAIFIGLEILLAGTGASKYLTQGISEAMEKLSEYGLLIPMFLQLATAYLALLLFCYVISSVSSMIGGSKGLSALLALGIIIGYIFATVMLTESLIHSEPDTIMYVFALFFGICAGIEFYAVTYIIKHKLNLQ